MFGELKAQARPPRRRPSPRTCAFDLGGRQLKLDSLWVNILKPGAAHSGHIHPHSVISGTVYVEIPPGAARLKLEDPRLPLMMAAPPRLPTRPRTASAFVYLTPGPGHGLHVGKLAAPRGARPTRPGPTASSISFNYGWR